MEYCKFYNKHSNKANLRKMASGQIMRLVKVTHAVSSLVNKITKKGLSSSHSSQLYLRNICNLPLSYISAILIHEKTLNSFADTVLVGCRMITLDNFTKKKIEYSFISLKFCFSFLRFVGTEKSSLITNCFFFFSLLKRAN